jgi:hypothetical protein
MNRQQRVTAGLKQRSHQCAGNMFPKPIVQTLMIMVFTPEAGARECAGSPAANSN